MDGVVELAKMLKERNNTSSLGLQIGKVVNQYPDLKVALEGILLDKYFLIFTPPIVTQIKDPDTYLKKNDRVILIPTQDNQLFFLIDKVGEL